MFSGTIFVCQRQPNPSVQLPRSCWAVYERLDGKTPIGQIADDLRLSEAETFAAIRQLQTRELIEESVLSYPAYMERNTQAQVNGRSVSKNGTAATPTSDRPPVSTNRDEDDRALHLPTLWEWLSEMTQNVKSYKNTQAFVLMEAADALEAIGVGSMEDLEEVKHCRDAQVVRALETAVKNNVGESIPSRCYG